MMNFCRSAFRILLLLPLLFAGVACERDGPDGPAPLPQHLVERFEDIPLSEGGTDSRFDAVFVDDQLRVVSEYLESGGVTARSRYLYSEDQLVFFHSRGGWMEDGAHHQIRAWAEFAMNGDAIGIDKQLDGDSIPVAPSEAEAIRERAALLASTAYQAQRPSGCDFNKSLRVGEALVTVIVPLGESCDDGMLRLFARTDEGSSVKEFERRGMVTGAWLDDFNADGKAELLLSMKRDEREWLRGWRVVDGRFETLDFADLSPVQAAGFDGMDQYRVESGRLLRRYRSADAERGLVFLAYNWGNRRWQPLPRPPRDKLQAQLAGHWTGELELRIPGNGPLEVSQDCGWLPYPVVALPGGLLHVQAPTAAPDACDGKVMELQPGTWLVESNAASLRMTGLTVEQRLELEAAENADSGGSTSD